MLSQIRVLLRPRFCLTIILFAALAFAMTVLCREHAVKAAVPVVFLLALVPVALIAGRSAALLVATAASLIFAWALFEPYDSLAIHNAADRIQLLCFGLAALAVVHFSPRPSGLPLTTSRSLSTAEPRKPSEPMETWIAVVGYAVVLTATVTLLLDLWNSIRY